jgi:hypothetical protein
MLACGCGRLGFATLGDAAVGAIDAAEAGDAPAACPSFATFCDGYETGDTSAWSQMFASAGGSLTVETATVHSGRFALHVIQPGASNSTDAETVHMLAAPQSTGVLTTRLWFYAVASLPANVGPLNLHDGTLAHYAFLMVYPNEAWTVSEQGTNGLHDHQSTTLLVAGTWTCLEVDYTFAPPAYAVYVNDVLAISGAAADTAPSFDRVSLGAQNVAPAGANADMIVDDIVIADRHIGCQ